MLKNSFAHLPDNNNSKTHFFHQYHLSGWKNYRNWQFGISANVLRDIVPGQPRSSKDFQAPTYNNMYRVNGWAKLQLGKGHTISARLNFVPSKIGRDDDYTFNDYRSSDWYEDKALLFNPSITLQNKFSREWSHQLDVSYLTASGKMEWMLKSGVMEPPTGNWHEQETHGGHNTDILLVRDRINYSLQADHWRVEPSVGFAFRHAKSFSESYYETFNDGQQTGFSYSTFNQKGNSFVLTPQMGLSFKNSIHLLAGLSADLSKEQGLDSNRLFPFASLAVDVLKLLKADHPYSAKVFASWSRPGDFRDMFYTRYSLSNEPAYRDMPSTMTLLIPYNGKLKYSSFQAGVQFSTNDRFTVSYNFDYRQNHRYVTYPIPAGIWGFGTGTTWSPFKFSGHRLGVTGIILKKSSFHWMGSLAINTYRIKMSMGQMISPDVFKTTNNGKPIWTGGLAQRIQYKKLSFGLDILYLLNEKKFEYYPPTYKSLASWKINNLYAAYTCKVRKKTSLEIYLSVSNPWQDKVSSFADRRRFYGAGFKASI